MRKDIVLRSLLVVSLAACATSKPPVEKSAPPPPPPVAEPKKPEPPPQIKPLEVGQVAPAFTLEVLNGDAVGQTRVSTRDHFGADAKKPLKALIVTFGASWCGPCKEEAPLLAKLAERYARKKVAVWSIITDTDEEGRAAMKKLLVDDLKVPHPVLADAFSILSRRYGAAKLPHVVLIGPAGRVAWVKSGLDEDLKELKKALKSVISR
jgi:thiol-disulfide isomerase/thioredoxin